MHVEIPRVATYFSEQNKICPLGIFSYMGYFPDGILSSGILSSGILSSWDFFPLGFFPHGIFSYMGFCPHGILSGYHREDGCVEHSLTGTVELNMSSFLAEINIFALINIGYTNQIYYFQLSI